MNAVRRRKDGDLYWAPSAEEKSKRRNNGGSDRRGFLLRGGLLAIGLVSAFLLYAYLTSPVNPVAVDDFPNLHGLNWPFKANTLLQDGVKLHPELRGAESIVYDENGHLYTGLEDGRIVRIRQKREGEYSEEVEILIDSKHLLKLIGEKERMKTRPLGLRYREGKLYIADPYQGILVLDTETKKAKRLVNYDQLDPPARFIDDLVLTKDSKTIYFTDASSRWHYHETAYSSVEGECSGRLLKFDINTRKVTTLLRGLCFANGVQLNEEETELVLAETNRCRLHVFDLSSLQILKTMILPGGPDNITPSYNGGYWVAIPMLHDSTMDIFLKFPVVRQILAGIFGKKGLFMFANLSRGVVVKLNHAGEAVRVLYDLEGKLSQAVTQVTETKNGDLLLGSFYANGIVQVHSSEHHRPKHK